MRGTFSSLGFFLAELLITRHTHNNFLALFSASLSLTFDARNADYVQLQILACNSLKCPFLSKRLNTSDRVQGPEHAHASLKHSQTLAWNFVVELSIASCTCNELLDFYLWLQRFCLRAPWYGCRWVFGDWCNIWSFVWHSLAGLNRDLFTLFSRTRLQKHCYDVVAQKLPLAERSGHSFDKFDFDECQRLQEPHIWEFL